MQYYTKLIFEVLTVILNFSKSNFHIFSLFRAADINNITAPVTHYVVLVWIITLSTVIRSSA